MVLKVIITLRSELKRFEAISAQLAMNNKQVKRNLVLNHAYMFEIFARICGIFNLMTETFFFSLMLRIQR